MTLDSLQFVSRLLHSASSTWNSPSTKPKMVPQLGSSFCPFQHEVTSSTLKPFRPLLCHLFYFCFATVFGIFCGVIIINVRAVLINSVHLQQLVHTVSSVSIHLHKYLHIFTFR